MADSKTQIVVKSKDWLGRPTQVEEYRDGKLVLTHSSEYNLFGQVSSLVTKDASGKLVKSIESSYNLFGILNTKKVVEIDKNGNEITSEYERLGTPKEIETSRIVKDANGNVVEKLEVQRRKSWILGADWWPFGYVVDPRKIGEAGYKLKRTKGGKVEYEDIEINDFGQSVQTTTRDAQGNVTAKRHQSLNDVSHNITQNLNQSDVALNNAGNSRNR